METKKVIVILLIIAILLSGVSIILNLSLNYDFKPLGNSQSKEFLSGEVFSDNPGGNVNFAVEPVE